MKIPAWYRNALDVSTDVARRDVVFVIGCQKSGTTWVQRLLDGHPNVCCRGEGHFSDVIGPMLEQATKLYNEQEKTVCALNETDLFSIVRLVSDQVLGKYLDECADREAIQIIGDKTPEAALAVPALATLYPGAKFVHVIRDGRDAAVSGWAQVQRIGADDGFASLVDYAAFFARRHWEPYITRARQAGSSIPGHYLEVRYEELHVEPVVHTRRMFDFLGMDATSDIVTACVEQAAFQVLSGGRERGEEDTSSHYRKGIVGDWKNFFDEAALQRFEAAAGWLLRELGYTDGQDLAKAA
jgi:hypothetical protein